MANKKNDITKDKDVKKILEAIDGEINSKKQAMLEEFMTKMDEQIEISVQKRVEAESKKFIRGKNGKIFRRDIVIVLLIALIGYMGYCLYQVGYFNKDLPATIYSVTQKLENNTPKKEVKDTAYYIENYGDLVENLQVPNSFEEIKNGISRDNLSNLLRLKIAYKNLSDDAKSNDGEIISFSNDSILEAYQGICGPNQTLEYVSFDYENLRFIYFNNMFITETASIIETPKMNYTITKAYEANGILTFELTYEGQIGIYKYIFENDGDSYYFNRIEKI